jgi:predicted metalloprotease
MRWKDERRSDNIEDRRSIRPAGIAVGGGIGTLIVVVVAVLLGADPRQVLNLVQKQQQQQGGAPQKVDRKFSAAEEERKDFVSAVLAQTEDVWGEQFQKMNLQYERPTLVLFTEAVKSEGCGFASAAVGPFYCPGDRNVYLDLGFFRELEERFKAPGDFAQAYVVAHEVGHHVQNLLGINSKVRRLQARATKEEANRLSVRLELQADFFAGVWAHHAQRRRQILEPGDVESALRAATAIGDDALQKQAQGYVVPDSFTHGTSEQRARWFRLGLKTGDINQGNTLEAESL